MNVRNVKSIIICEERIVTGGHYEGINIVLRLQLVFNIKKNQLKYQTIFIPLYYHYLKWQHSSSILSINWFEAFFLASTNDLLIRHYIHRLSRYPYA